MKHLMTAAVLALGLAAAEQKAQAWSKLNLSTGCNLCLETGGRTFTRTYNRSTSTAPAPWGVGGPEMGGYPVPMPAPHMAAPAPMPKEKEQKDDDAQPVGYYGQTPAAPNSNDNYGYNYNYGYYPYGYGYYGY
jgi:hypothetical protein